MRFPGAPGLLVLLAIRSTAWAHDRASLDAGDTAWLAADRSGARTAWQAASAAPDPAVRAQAEARLLLVSGNLGLAVHGPRAERALAICADSDPWCDIAAADLVLFGRLIGVPLPLQEAIQSARAAEGALPGPAAARLVWAGAAPLDSLSGFELDGLGRAVAAAEGRFPSGPGTWVAGVGVLGASGQGTGGGLRWVHPDVGLAGWRLESHAFLTTRLAGQVAVQVTSPGTWGVSASTQTARLVVDRYDPSGTVRPGLIQSSSVALQPHHRSRRWAVRAGPELRWDRVGTSTLKGHGGALSTAWSRPSDIGTLTLDGSISLSLADYDHQEGRASIRLDAADSRFGLWLHGAAAPWSEAPYWRLPAAGGGQVLRHGPVGRFRGRELAASVVEWRVRPEATVGGVAFLEGAHIDGWHGGAGLGLRLRLPPRPNNTVRLDVAFGDGGLGISAGWGEAF